MVFKKTRTIYPHRDATKFYSYWTTFHAMWTSFKERLKIEKDDFILVTGTIGGGKSTFVGKICFNKAMREINFIKYPEIADKVNKQFDHINKKIKDLDRDGSEYKTEKEILEQEKEEIIEKHKNYMMFIPEKHFIVDSDEFSVKMITEEGATLWYDEARQGANRQQWYDKINKSIKQRKNTNRKKFNIYFMVMPLEREMDPNLASHLTAWIWIRRGVGEVYVANNERKGGRGLNIDAILKREEKYLSENPGRTVVPPTIHSEFIGRIGFGKFNKREDKMYNDLVKKKSATGKLTDEEKEKFGIDVSKSDDEVIENVVKKIKDKIITDKMTLWDELRDLTIADEKKKTKINFYLDLYGLESFAKLFNKNKEKMSDLANKYKR